MVWEKVVSIKVYYYKINRLYRDCVIVEENLIQLFV